MAFNRYVLNAFLVPELRLALGIQRCLRIGLTPEES